MTPERLLVQLSLVTAAACGAATSGCSVLPTSCAQDWYDSGLREGRMGGQPWDIQYAAACGNRFDQARYIDGWRIGFNARPLPQGL